MRHRPTLRSILPLAAALAVSGCGSRAEVDPRELHQAQSAIEDAQQLDAGRPPAAVLREAEERLAVARRRVDEGHAEEALRLLREARVLATRAEAESLARQAVDAARSVEQSLSAMQRALDVEQVRAAARSD